MNKYEVERLSKRSAKKIIQGTDKLKSYGTTGWYHSKRLNRWFKFKSMIEANVIRTLDEAQDLVIDFDTEVFMIPYNFKGATLNYVPDVILKTKNGNRFVIEVKPTSKFNDEKNKAKWERAKTWCWERGIRFFVISEKDWKHLKEIILNFEQDNIDQAQQLLEWKIIN